MATADTIKEEVDILRLIIASYVNDGRCFLLFIQKKGRKK